MIKLENVSFSYGKNSVLKNISSVFERGKLHCIIGPNGCGKTTLIRLISKLENMQEGKISIDGKEIQDYSIKEYAKKVALLPQGRNIPSISVKSFVSHGRFPYLGFSRKMTEKDKKAVENALLTTECSLFADRSMKELSGGERQRAYIAMLVAQDTPYVLLDEPTTYLDIKQRLDFMSLTAELKNSGKGVIAVLHDLPTALKFSDCVTIMKDGEILLTAPPAILAKSDIWETVFNVQCKEITIDGEKEYIFKDK